MDLSPEYLGVGYVIGPRIAGVMFAGGVLSWLVLLPLLSYLGNFMTVPLPPVPASGLRIDQMSAAQLWSAYIRYTGAGAVLAAGSDHARPDDPDDRHLVQRQREGFRHAPAAPSQRARTERDLPLRVVLVGSLAAGDLPGRRARHADAGQRPRRPILIVLFGFFFVTVSSRITGLIGNSSNPISGMTIATLILTCTIFVAVGWIGDDYAPIALGVGAVVCIAAAIAGATSQDLKTGILVGATPIHAADRAGHRRRDLGVRHRHHHAVPARGDDDRIGIAARAAGDADVHDHPRAAQPEPAVGTRARRRLHLGHARAVRHQVALLCRRLVPANPDDGAHLRWRHRALVGGTQDRPAR